MFNAWDAAAAVAFGALATGGAVALATGWVVPWLRRSVVRPKLWGAGILLFAAGMATAMSMMVVDGPLAVTDGMALTAFALIIVGTVLQGRAQRRRSAR